MEIMNVTSTYQIFKVCLKSFDLNMNEKICQGGGKKLPIAFPYFQERLG